MFDLGQLQRAQQIVHAAMPPTPAHVWPLLSERLGATAIVKHENHTPIGAFKVRGGLVYLDRLTRERPHTRGLVSATRGNHGQSLAFAASRYRMPVTIYVPQGNSTEKNRAMRAFGANLIEFGTAPDLDILYVPIGQGSGICGCILARDLLGLSTEIIGVQSTLAPSYALSFAAGAVVMTNSSDTLADGMATRVPDPDALAIIRRGASRIMQVTDDEVAAAIRAYWTDTHNLAEGAGAAPLAAALQDKARLSGKRVGLILSGGNIDFDLFRRWVVGEAVSGGGVLV